jgi:hypothetical protein
VAAQQRLVLQLPPSNRAVLAKLAELCREISLLASTDAHATAQTLAVLLGEIEQHLLASPMLVQLS